MAYVPNQLSCLVRDIGNFGPARWTLFGIDPIATVQGVNFVTDAADKGMKVNDLVEYTDTNLGIVYDMKVIAVNKTKAVVGTVNPGSADLGDGTVVGLATNS